MRNIKISIFILGCLFLLANSLPLSAWEKNRVDLLKDSALLDSVQRRTFNYFWDGAEPVSGMARERLHVDGDDSRQEDRSVVTSGGSGFGIMAILAGIDRGYVTREAGLDRMTRIVSFLERADKFHGAFPHWWYGETGRVKPFGKKDNGGDLVETAFLMQGLLAVHQYYVNGTEGEKELAERIDKLWQNVDWNWYRNEKNVLYWHWSPDYQWEMNFPVHGYNECLIMYILAAASPTHSVPAEVYHEGWAEKGAIVDMHQIEGYPLNLRYQGTQAGPLFWAHYSFLGLDPNGLKDRYADYFEEMKNYTLVNRAYCIRNPKNYKGYSEDCWGLTSSYSTIGYAGHAPSERTDHGVISPTAALSSIVYTPEESMQVMRHLYGMGDKVWGPYGFYDAFSETAGWYPQWYLAIDQGPIAVMIENYRSKLLWNLFMSHPDVQKGLRKLGFSTPHLDKPDLASEFYIELPVEKKPFPKPVEGDGENGFSWRGIKGWAWTPEQMLAEIPFLKQCKMNFFMNCYFSMFDFPDEDNQWWEPLPGKLKSDYEKIVTVCKANDIEFCFAMNPNLNSSRYINMHDKKDFESLWQHYKWMAELGVNWFCVCLDDVTKGINGIEQALVVNRLYERILKINPRAKMIFCPTIYASAWIPNTPDNVVYLYEVGKTLNPDIYCFWTGDDVRGPISVDKAKEFKKLINHELFVWDNYPVNNGVPNLNLGPVVYRDPGLSRLCEGYVSNSMRYENELNRIPMFTIADYTWNPEAYDPVRSVQQAILHLTDTREQAELLKDVTNVYYGFLLGPDRHSNTARVTFNALVKEKQSVLQSLLFVRHLEDILNRFETLYPTRYQAEKKVIKNDILWMKDCMFAKYPQFTEKSFN